jgi:ABC-type nitrate/sulfonate/bicarbonate transport system permease component
MATTAVAGSRETKPRDTKPGDTPAWRGGLIGFVGLLVLWEVGGLLFFSGRNGLIPPPTRIVSHMFDDGFVFYWHNARDTLYEAFVGWLWGNVLAILLAFSFLVAPILERPLTRLGVVSYCLPIIAIAPILTLKFQGQAPNMILAALSVFFTTLVGTLVGLRSADKTALDVVHAYGGGAIKKLTKVRLRAALPSLFAALRIAAPAAILGAIIGDYFGAERGLGVAMVAAQTGLEIPRTWGLAIVASALAGAAYGITALVGRLLTPWAPRGTGS